MTWTDWPDDELGVGFLAEVADLNTFLSGNLLHLYERPHCSVTHNTTQSAAEGETELVMNTDLSDVDGMHGAGAEITLNRTGVWAAEAFAQFGADADGYRYIRIQNIGTVIKMRGAAAGSSSGWQLCVTGHDYAVSGQEVSVFVAHNAGGALTIATNPFLAVTWLSESFQP